MARRRTDDVIKRRMWSALLRSAMDYHNATAERGMITRIAQDAGVSKASVSEWKHATSYPEDATLRRLASLYRVSSEYLSGYKDSTEDYGPPDIMLTRAADITESIIEELLPQGSVEQFVRVMRRAHELVLEGKQDAEVRGTLFEEVRAMKREP